MNDIFERTRLLLGEEYFNKIGQSSVIVFGIGGVGGYVVEALVRSGISKITIVDYDTVDWSNINRQVIATTKTVGRKKVEVLKERILEINPQCKVIAMDEMITSENVEKFSLMQYNYTIDAIDNMSAKIRLAEYCFHKKLPLLSCMGTGNKLDPMGFQIADLFETKNCPVARVLRRELRRKNVSALTVCYSQEVPKNTVISDGKRNAPASIAFVPPAAGLLMASKVIKDLGEENDNEGNYHKNNGKLGSSGRCPSIRLRRKL